MIAISRCEGSRECDRHFLDVGIVIGDQLVEQGGGIELGNVDRFDGFHKFDGASVGGCDEFDRLFKFSRLDQFDRRLDHLRDWDLDLGNDHRLNVRLDLGLRFWLRNRGHEHRRHLGFRDRLGLRDGFCDRLRNRFGDRGHF